MPGAILDRVENRGEGRSRPTLTPYEKSPGRRPAGRGRGRGTRLRRWQRKRPLSAASPPQATPCSKGKLLAESVPRRRTPGGGTTHSERASQSSLCTRSGRPGTL